MATTYRYDWDVFGDIIRWDDWSVYKKHSRVKHFNDDFEVWEFYVDRWWRFKRIDKWSIYINKEENE